jgi:lipopolysaccharide export LptBFGC system permease protein LptF
MSLDYGVAYSARPGKQEVSILKFNRAEIDLLRIFQEQILGADAAEDDYRSYTPTELVAFIDTLAAKPDRDDKLYWKARYLLHKRIASPFAVIVFALFGMVLGVSDPRRGKSIGYIGAIGAIIGGYVLMMGFGWLAENGHLAAPIAAWLPNVLLVSFAGFLVYQKNRLPPSEGTLDWANLPFRRRRRFGA